MGFWANMAAKSEMKVRDQVLTLIHTNAPEIDAGNVNLPCHIISEVHNGFYLSYDSLIVGVFRCQSHWWMYELTVDSLDGLRSPEPDLWMHTLSYLPPYDIGSMSIPLDAFVAGLVVNMTDSTQ